MIETQDISKDQTPLFIPVVFTPGEREVFRRRKKLPPSQWAEKNIVVTSGPRPGPWQNRVTPYLVEIMDTWALPWVRKVVLCAAPQTAKSSAQYNCMAYAAKRQPGPGLVVMSDEAAVKRIYKRRIKPLFDKSPNLAKMKTENALDFSAAGITLNTGMTIDLAWAHSASALASLPIQYVFLDETDKYPPFIRGEADPISLAEVRTRTFKFTYKIFTASSPTIEAGFIWQELNNCREVRDLHVPCPKCGTYQMMAMEHIKRPKGEWDPGRIEDRRLAWYECPICRAKWDDHDRDRAVQSKMWVAREKVEKPSSVGFHLPAWYSPFVSLSECMAEFIRGQTDKGKLRHFQNSIEAKPWVDYSVDRREDQILALRDERKRGVVPSEISCLTASADVQEVGFWYEIRAWGWGPELESWQIAEGFLETWGALREVLTQRYKDVAGNEHVIRLALIDSGHKTAEVYQFCHSLPGAFPTKGQQRMSRPWSATRLETLPDGRSIRNGLLLYNLNTTFFKDQLAGKLEISPADPGAWHLNSDSSPSYAQQMCAEFRDERGIWQCPSHKANHLWDCGVGNLAAADVLRLAFSLKPSEQNQTETKKPTPKRREGRW